MATAPKSNANNSPDYFLVQRYSPEDLGDVYQFCHIKRIELIDRPSLCRFNFDIVLPGSKVPLKTAIAIDEFLFPRIQEQLESVALILKEQSMQSVQKMRHPETRWYKAVPVLSREELEKIKELTYIFMSVSKIKEFGF